MPGASGLEDVWVPGAARRGRLPDRRTTRRAAACDAMIVPVVAGKLNATVPGPDDRSGPGCLRPPPPRLGKARPGQPASDVSPGGPDTRDPDRGAHRDQIGQLSAAAAARRLRRRLLPLRRRPPSPVSRPGTGEISPQGVAGAPLRPSPSSPSTWSPGRPGSPRSCAAACSSHPWNTPSLPLGHRLLRDHPRLDPPRRQLARPLQMRLARLRPTRGLVRRPPHQAQERRRQNQRRLLRHAMPLPS